MFLVFGNWLLIRLSPNDVRLAIKAGDNGIYGPSIHTHTWRENEHTSGLAEGGKAASAAYRAGAYIIIRTDTEYTSPF